MKKIRTNKRGVSLVEVMAAMLVLAIGILGIAPLMVVTIGANSFSRELTVANTLAADKIESLRAIGAFAPLPFTQHENNINNKYSRYTRIDAYESDVTVPTGVYRVHVTISWSDQNGIPRATEYWTFLSRN